MLQLLVLITRFSELLLADFSLSFTNAAPRNLSRKKGISFVLSASMGFALVESKTIDLISSKASLCIGRFINQQNGEVNT